MEAIGHILPIALAVAISSVPIMVTILILLSPNRARSAPLFMIGWVIGLILVVSVCTLVAELIPTARSPRRPDTAIGIVEIIVGLAMIVLAVVSWLRSRRAETPAVPKWLSSEKSLRPWQAFGVALILNIRPKALLLAIAAGLTVRADSQSPTDAVVAILIYTIIGASTVVTPIVATMVAPDRMVPRLTSMRSWLTRNDAAMTSIILLLVGVFVIGSGIGRLG
ncbi:GAP family protein [Microbacterium pumilum]|uniref:GAP family protein n=1 Tax=Microbacterium pumilum TaxID=344165 RepID=A0ABP5EDL9_9MICO